MEPAAAVELFNRAPNQSVKFSVYTGDDDSTTEAHVRQKVIYGVNKFSDIIHMKRSLTTRLYNQSKIWQLLPFIAKSDKLPSEMFFLCYCSKQGGFKGDPGCS